MKRTTSVCPQCGKEFSYYPSSYNGKKTYCSKECFSKSRKTTGVCPVCGKVFEYYKCWPEFHCSRACAALASIGNHLGVTPLEKRFCEVCGKEITKNKTKDSRFCSSACWGEYQRGKEVPKRHARVTKKCSQCGKEYTVKKNQQERSKFCSRDCYITWQRTGTFMKGESNYFWRGGYDDNYGPNWQQQRRNARRRDNYTCQRCGITEGKLGRQLDVHHVVPFRLFGIEHYQEANLVSNLICYCHDCHIAVEHTYPH